MKFVLADDAIYKEVYEPEHYKYARLHDIEDLLGYAKVHVRVHEGWSWDLNDERIDFLEQQIEALAAFGYVKLTYIDEEGFEEEFKTQQIRPQTPQKRFSFEEGGELRGSSQNGSQAVVDYVIEDDGCEGGACKI